MHIHSTHLYFHISLSIRRLILSRIYTPLSTLLAHTHPTIPPSPITTSSQSHTNSSQDISANGANYVLSVAGKTGLVYGTSASAPVVGAILTLINDYRLVFGKKPIGFINPVLYELGKEGRSGGLKDIVSGG